MGERNMIVERTIKAAGIPSLKYVSEKTDLPTRTINNWFHKRRKVFDMIVKVCAEEYEKEKEKYSQNT